MTTEKIERHEILLSIKHSYEEICANFFLVTITIKQKILRASKLLALFGMTSRTLDCPITGRAINAEIWVAGSQLDKRILL